MGLNYCDSRKKQRSHLYSLHLPKNLEAFLGSHAISVPVFLSRGWWLQVPWLLVKPRPCVYCLDWEVWIVWLILSVDTWVRRVIPLGVRSAKWGLPPPSVCVCLCLCICILCTWWTPSCGCAHFHPFWVLAYRSMVYHRGYEAILRSYISLCICLQCFSCAYRKIFTELTLYRTHFWIKLVEGSYPISFYKDVGMPSAKCWENG